MSINFEDDRMQSIEAANNASTLSEKVMQLKDLEDEIANAEESVKKLKEQARIISCIEIPQMMETMNIKKLKVKDGESVQLKKIYSASILEEKQQEAFEWLRNNGRGDIIKNDVTVTFGRGEDNKAAEYAVLAQGQGYQPTQKLKVEPMTLKALVRERIEAGKEMPTELFNIYVGNKTTIKRKQ